MSSDVSNGGKKPNGPEGPLALKERECAEAAEARVMEVERQRDELRKALQDELDNWNPESRPTITARAEAAEARVEALRGPVAYMAALTPGPAYTAEIDTAIKWCREILAADEAEGEA